MNSSPLDLESQMDIFCLPWKFSHKHYNTKERFLLAPTYDTPRALKFQMKKSLGLKQKETIYPKVNLKDFKGTSSR